MINLKEKHSTWNWAPRYLLVKKLKEYIIYKDTDKGKLIFCQKKSLKVLFELNDFDFLQALESAEHRRPSKRFKYDGTKEAMQKAHEWVAKGYVVLLFKNDKLVGSMS